jgi:hypothetical protein
MITYEVSYIKGSRPVLSKVISVGGESFSQTMLFDIPKEDLDLIDTSLIFQHLDNIVLYIQDMAESMRVVALDEVRNEHNDFLINMFEIMWAREEAKDWWMYARENREPEDL